MRKRLKMKLSQIVEKAKNYNHIYLSGHINPDGDCIGATIAMVQLLENAGVNTKVLLMEQPDMFDYLPMQNYVQSEVPEDADLLITLDASDVERLGDFGKLVGKVETINIDHHISNTEYGHINYVDGEASSTCEMVYHMIDHPEWLNKSIAEALYTGIVYDTGAFKHSNTKPSTHVAVAELIKYGIDFTWIVSRIFYEKPFKAYKAQSLAYDRLRLEINDQVAVSWLNYEDFIELGIVKNHIESIVQLMNDMQGIEAAVFFYAVDPGTYKMSLRSKGDVDVCKVASAFGGGGHIKASGASFKGSIDECIEAVLGELSKQLNG